MSNTYYSGIVVVRERDRWTAEILLVGYDRGRRLKLPGGKEVPGETPRQTAARELREETGLVVRPRNLKPLGMRALPSDEDAASAHRQYYFLAMGGACTGKLRMEPLMEEGGTLLTPPLWRKLTGTLLEAIYWRHRPPIVRALTLLAPKRSAFAGISHYAPYSP